MDDYANFLATPPMYRDIGSTFLEYQMPMPMMGMPYMGYGYGVSPMRPTLSNDVFEKTNQQKSKNKAKNKKVFAAIGMALLGMLGLTILKNKALAKKAAVKAATTAAVGSSVTAGTRVVS